MTKELHKSTQDLISSIERKDRIFRISQGLFMSLLIIALIGVILLQSRTLNAVQQQLLSQKGTVAEIKKDNNEQLGRINRHLDCIVVYFQQVNRTQLKIDDINKCTLSNGTSIQQFFTTPADSKGNTAPATAGPVTSLPADNGQPAAQSPPAAAAQTPTPAPKPGPTSDPIKILGMPVCLPFTSKCLLH